MAGRLHERKGVIFIIFGKDTCDFSHGLLTFIILGNYMQRAKQNFFIGIRTPWTLSNDVVWRKTHRLASKVFVAAGICIIMNAFLPTAFQLPILLAVMIITVVVPYIASFLFFKKK